MSTLIEALLDDSEAEAIIDLTQSDEALRSWRYEELKGAVNRLQVQLYETFHVGRGTVVGMVLGNDVAFVLAFLAVSALGAVTLPLNPAYSEEEFTFSLKDVKASVLIVEKNKVPPSAQSLPAKLSLIEVKLCLESDVGMKKVVAEPGFTPPKKLATKGGASSDEANTGRAARNDLISTQSTQPTGDILAAPEDVALVLHTSGTTSRPKAVPLTHSNLVASIKNICGTYEFTSSDTGLLVMPLFHVHGLMCGLFAPLAAGSRVIFPAAGRFSASTFWEDVTAFNITWFTAVPTMLYVLLKRTKEMQPADRASTATLRFIRSCSAALNPATLRELEEFYGVPVLEAYAMTEASHQMTSNPLRGDRIPGSVGLPHGAVEVCILDTGTCSEMPRGQVGEICVKGPNVTRGYLENPAANASSFTSDGWFRTGDLGIMDDRGYVSVTGRIKEMINRGGEKISPVELDNVLAECPGVEEAVTFGVPDGKYGEVVAAAIVLKKNTSLSNEDIRQFMSSRVAKFKLPEHIYFLDKLPRTSTGKLQRKNVAKLLLD